MEQGDEDNELINKINKDLVGDTAYSAKWILETLVSLSKIEKDELPDEMESQLCVLWDMTTEKDVADFLIDNNFLFITEFVLQTSNNPRLKEIVIGIVGNICSQPETFAKISNESGFIPKVLGLLFDGDSKVLIQVLRILQTAIWDVKTNESSNWKMYLKDCAYLGNVLVFILDNSLDEELLQSTLNFIHSIVSSETLCDEFLKNLIDCNSNALSALIETFKTLFKEPNFESKQKELSQWVEIISNILYKQPPEIKLDFVQSVTNILTRILKEKESNINFLDENSALCIHECVQIIYWIQKKNYLMKIEGVLSIVEIMKALKIALDAKPDDETAKELLDYLERYWANISKESEILQMINENCSSDTQTYLKSLSSNN